MPDLNGKNETMNTGNFDQRCSGMNSGAGFIDRVGHSTQLLEAFAASAFSLPPRHVIFCVFSNCLLLTMAPISQLFLFIALYSDL